MQAKSISTCVASEPYYRARYYDPQNGRFISEDPIEFESDNFDLYAYVGNDPIGYIDPSGYERKPGKTPPKRWPPLPPGLCGNKPKWNSEGYWEGKGRRITWDDRSHGSGVDRGQGAQGGHWDDETSDNRWDQNGNLLPGSEGAQSTGNSPQQPQWWQKPFQGPFWDHVREWQQEVEDDLRNALKNPPCGCK